MSYLLRLLLVTGPWCVFKSKNSECIVDLGTVCFGQGYGIQGHIQQYFSYIVAIILLMGESGVPEENHRPVTSHL